MAEIAAPGWSPAPRALSLPPGELHVWRIALDAPPDRETRLVTTLDQVERACAAGFRFPQHRRRYRVAHGALRLLLGRYTGRAPADLIMALGPHGKPALTGIANLHFNLAHAGETALVALASDRAVGVDLEELHDLPDLPRLAARYFTPLEQAVLAALPSAEQGRAFLAGWTRKEAVMKALGLGVAQPPETIEVTLTSDEAILLRLDGRPAPGWHLRPLAPGPGYTGTVAARGPAWNLRCWQWEEGQGV